MQEEVTLIVDGAKLSEQVFEKAVKKFLEEIQKSQKPKIYRGRHSADVRKISYNHILRASDNAANDDKGRPVQI